MTLVSTWQDLLASPVRLRAESLVPGKSYIMVGKRPWDRKLHVGQGNGIRFKSHVRPAATCTSILDIHNMNTSLEVDVNYGRVIMSECRVAFGWWNKTLTRTVDGLGLIETNPSCITHICVTFDDLDKIKLAQI
jgi:hypothetical protein